MKDREVDRLLKEVREKLRLDDYDLGVLATLRWFQGQPNPYAGRVE